MGISNRIEDRQAVDANPHGESTGSATMDANPGGVPTRVAEPCPTCRCPMWWRSRYGGELLCGDCDPWPARALRGEYWAVVVGESGGYEWEAFEGAIQDS